MSTVQHQNSASRGAIAKIGNYTSSASSKRTSKSGSGDIQYVLPIGNGWLVKGKNAARFTILTDSKREAVEVARRISILRKGELIVYGKDRKIQYRRNFNK